MAPRECLGAYECNEGKCGECPLALLCVDMTIARDGYYDELAAREKGLWEYEDQLLVDAATRDAELR